MENRYHTYRDNLPVASIYGSTTSTSGNLPHVCGNQRKGCSRFRNFSTSRAPNPFHDYEVVMAQRWTVYTPKSMGRTDAEFITEVLSTSGIERTYLGYTNGITQHAYLEIGVPDDWDGETLIFGSTGRPQAHPLIPVSCNYGASGRNSEHQTRHHSTGIGDQYRCRAACGMSVHSLRILRYPAAGSHLS